MRAQAGDPEHSSCVGLVCERLRVELFAAGGDKQCAAVGFAERTRCCLGDRKFSQFGRRGLRLIVFVLNISGYISERLLCKDMALAYNDIAAWNYAQLPHALGCQGWSTTRVSSCGELDDALKTTEQAEGAADIEVITDAYEAPPLYKKLHENVKSFYNVQ